MYNMPKLINTILIILLISMSVCIIIMCINIISNVLTNRANIEEDKKNIIVEL
jgi:hypothetical protein